MALNKRQYVDGQTIVTASNLNEIQDCIIAIEGSYVPKTRKVAGKALSSDITLSAGDVGAVPTSRTINAKALTGNIILSAADVGAVPVARTVNGKALSSNITLSAADVSAVPSTRTVNSKALSQDISLTASDVGAVPTGRTVNEKALSSDITLAASDVGAVPTGRTVNGKALSSNIILTASDVGAVPTSRTVNSKALSSNITLTASDVGAVPTERTVNGKALSANITLASFDIGDDSGAGGSTVKASLAALKDSLNTILPLDTTPTSGSTKGITSDGVHKALNTHVRPNLLDNWYFVGGGSQQGNSQFPINQRGQTIYNATSREWTIDRWNKRADGQTGTFSVTIGQDGLVLDSSIPSESTSLRGISQPIENPDALLGKTLTLSVLIKDFDTSREGIEFGLYGSSNGLNQTDWYGRIQGINADGLYTTIINMPTSYKNSNNSHLNIALFRSGSFKCTVVAIKLEVGDGQTLAHEENNQWVLNEIPDFQEQLYKCNTNAAYSSPSDQYSHKTNAYVDDTGWVDLELTSQFTKYGDVNGARLRYRKIGNIVTIRGVIKPTSEIAAGWTEIAVSTIPESIRPDFQVTMVQQGSEKNSFTTKVATNGTLSISRYGTTDYISIPASAWLNIYVVYMI